MSTVPRATVLSLRTMEHLRSWGLEATIRAGGNDVEPQMLSTRTLSHARRGTPIDVGYPTIAASALISPTRPAAVPPSAPLYAPYNDGMWLQGADDGEMSGLYAEPDELPAAWGGPRTLGQFTAAVERATAQP